MEKQDERFVAVPRRVDNKAKDPKPLNNRSNNANVKPQRFDTSAYIGALDIGEISRAIRVHIYVNGARVLLLLKTNV